MKLWLKLSLIGLLGGLAASVACVRYIDHWQHTTDSILDTGVFALERGQSFAAFARQLHEAGVIAQPRLWTYLARYEGSATRIKAGEYEIRADDTPAGLIARLVARDVVTYQIQMIEGWTILQSVAALAGHPVLRKELGEVSEQTLLGVLGLPEGHAEGLFFPDTYQFERGHSDADVLRRAYQQMQQVLERAWALRDDGLPYQSPYEALIVASLIEKETGYEGERTLIGQVFVNRLRIGMRLQTDPTVIYGLGDRFDGNLTRAHLREDTPYNTYVHGGLPPSPIALPGERSIMAALHPAPGDFLYFVSRGDGTSYFSRSLDEHNRAVRQYQLR